MKIYVYLFDHICLILHPSSRKYYLYYYFKFSILAIFGKYLSEDREVRIWHEIDKNDYSMGKK